MSSSTTAALQQVLTHIKQACDSASRSADTVALLAVSKGHSGDAVRELAAAGQCDFGENYVQEALDKIALLQDLPGLRWHFIGRLQTNKTQLVAQHFDWCHSVDRLSIAERLSRQRPQDKPPLQVCVQVNLDGDEANTAPQRGGISPGQPLEDLLKAMAQLPHIRLRGLMTLPPQSNPEPAFVRLQQLLSTAPVALDTLSMGMSADYLTAIHHGATWVRIGTSLFGARPGAKIRA